MRGLESRRKPNPRFYKRIEGGYIWKSFFGQFFFENAKYEKLFTRWLPPRFSHPQLWKAAPSTSGGSNDAKPWRNFLKTFFALRKLFLARKVFIYIIPGSKGQTIRKNLLYNLTPPKLFLSMSLWQSAGDSKRFWKHLEVLLFSLICIFSVKTVQNSGKLSASKCFQMLPNSENSAKYRKQLLGLPALCHTSTTRRKAEGA